MKTWLYTLGQYLKRHWLLLLSLTLIIFIITIQFATHLSLVKADRFEKQLNLQRLEFKGLELEKTLNGTKTQLDTVKGENEANKAEIERLKQQLSAKKSGNAVYAAAQPVGDGIWDRLASCESGNRWDYDGPSGFDGGLQFLPSTWTSMGTAYTYAWQAPREVQIEAATRLQARAGWGQWPACAKQLGLL